MNYKLDIHRTPTDRNVIAISAPGSSRYTYVARVPEGFTVGGSTPFASPIAAAKFARRVLRSVIDRVLTPEEKAEYRAWAHENFHVGMTINPLWHPVVRDECRKIEQDDYDRSKWEQDR